MMDTQVETWCHTDGHADYELFEDFNAWINQGDVELDLPLLVKLSSVGLSNPSKAFFAGDREAYEQALSAYCIDRRQEVLSRTQLIDALGEEDGNHWFERNEQRFNQLLERLADQIGSSVHRRGYFS